MAPVLLLTPQPSRGSSRRGQGRPARPCAHGAFRKLMGEDAGTLETRAVPAGPRRCCSQARVPHLPCGDLGGRASPFFLPPCVAVDSGVSNSREEISERVQIACVFVCLSSLKTVARRGGSPRLKLSAGRRRRLRLRRRPRGPSGPACRQRPEAAFVPRPRPASWGLGRDSPPHGRAGAEPGTVRSVSVCEVLCSFRAREPQEVHTADMETAGSVGSGARGAGPGHLPTSQGGRPRAWGEREPCPPPPVSRRRGRGWS